MPDLSSLWEQLEHWFGEFGVGPLHIPSQEAFTRRFEPWLVEHDRSRDEEIARLKAENEQLKITNDYLDGCRWSESVRMLAENERLKAVPSVPLGERQLVRAMNIVLDPLTADNLHQGRLAIEPKSRAHPGCWGPEGHVCRVPSGRKCANLRCNEEGGTRWGPHWCPEHDVERLERVSAGFAALVEKDARHLVPVSAPIPCPTCGGSGTVDEDDPPRGALKGAHWACPHCSDGWYRGEVQLVVEQHAWHCPCSCHGSRGMTVEHVAPCCNSMPPSHRKVGTAVIERVLPVARQDVPDGSSVYHDDDSLILFDDEAQIATDVSHLLPFWPVSATWAVELKEVR